MTTLCTYKWEHFSETPHLYRLDFSDFEVWRVCCPHPCLKCGTSQQLRAPLLAPLWCSIHFFNTASDTLHAGEMTPRLVGWWVSDIPVLSTFGMIVVHLCRDYLNLQHVSLIGALFSDSREYEDLYLFLGASPQTVTITYSMAPWCHCCSLSPTLILIVRGWI